MVSNDDLKKDIGDMREENRKDHNDMFKLLREHGERITRTEERTKTLWGIVAGIGGACLALVVACVAYLFKGFKCLMSMAIGACIILILFSGCAMFERTYNPDGTVNPSIMDYVADTATSVATAGGLVPPGIGATLLGVIGLGAAEATRRGIKHKRERIKLGKALLAAKKELTKEQYDAIIAALNIDDKKFYEKYIKEVK